MVLLHFYTDLCVLHSRKTLEKEQNKDKDDSGPHSADAFLIITKHIQGTYKKRVHLIHLTFFSDKVPSILTSFLFNIWQIAQLYPSAQYLDDSVPQ